jgi:ABC-2 type transport system permease protein
MSKELSLIRAELLKLSTIRTFWWTLAATLAIVPAGVALAILGSGHNGAASLDTTEGLRNAIGAGSSGGVLLIVIGVVVMAGEFRFDTITSTCLITPHRRQVMAAKLAASLLVGIGAGIATSLLTVAITLPWLSSRHIDLGPHVGDFAIVLVGSIGSTAIGGLLGVGIGSMITNQTSAITITLIWVFVVEGMVGKFASGVGSWFPGGAASAMAGGGISPASLLPMWGGALVLTGYSLVFSSVGTRLLVQRDLS